jgi:hypothetical protein
MGGHGAAYDVAIGFRRALLLLAALSAALLTHFVVDVLGDFVLAHDTYDDLAHGSRQGGALALGICLVLTLAFAARAALVEARGNEGVLLALLRRAMPRCPWRHWAAVTFFSLILVAVMEACDAAAAGSPCDDLTELLGGSLLLASIVAAIVGALISILLRAALCRLTAIHRALVYFVEALILVGEPNPTLGASRGRTARRTCGSPGAVLSRSAGGRAPPRFLSLVPHKST